MFSNFQTQQIIFEGKLDTNAQFNDDCFVRCIRILSSPGFAST